MGGRIGGGARPQRRRIDDEAKGIFLDALRRGALLQDAARLAGFSPSGFCKARERDPAFAEAWEEAMELSNAPRFVAPGNNRQWQLKRIRRLRFEGWRREVFLAHFAGTCDLTAGAEAAGVVPVTVYRHLAKDSDFAAAFREALQQGYARLEAEAIRQRLVAQQQLREGVIPVGEVAAEFDKVMKLLARWDKGGRTISHGNLKRCTFDEAIDTLDRKLQALGARRNRDGGAKGDEAAA